MISGFDRVIIVFSYCLNIRKIERVTKFGILVYEMEPLASAAFSQRLLLVSMRLSESRGPVDFGYAQSTGPKDLILFHHERQSPHEFLL